MNGMITVLCCQQCGNLPNSCECPEGVHYPDRIEPHPFKVACAECATPTHEMVFWPVGPDSYSFAPLCLDHRNVKLDDTMQRPDAHHTRSAMATGLDNDSVSDWIAGRKVPLATRVNIRGCGDCTDEKGYLVEIGADDTCPGCGVVWTE